MATPRDPTKLEPAYLITLAVIVGLPICCSFLNRHVPPPPPPKMSIPQAGTWKIKMKDGSGPAATSHIAVRGGKWRVETRYPDSNDTMVVVHDEQRSAANSNVFQPEQLAMLDPLKQLQAIAFAYNQHPKPESEALNGILCWHANVREGDDQAETWLDANTGFPKKFQTRRRTGRAISYDFESFSSQVPNDPRIFDTAVLEPVLTP